MKNKIFCYFLAILLCSGVVWAQEDLRLEGIVEDKNPSQSLAIVNGQPYQIRDKIGDAEVIQIGSRQITLRDAAGKESALLVEEAVHPAPAFPSPAAGEKEKSLLDQTKELIQNPKKIGNLAWELKALRDLAILNNAAVHYYEKNQFFPVKLKQLISEGFLKSDYESGKINKYQFYFSNQSQKPDDFQLHADPLDPASGLRYFFVGPDALIRVSEGKPADAHSPLH